jgi:hypothetical protein
MQPRGLAPDYPATEETPGRQPAPPEPIWDQPGPISPESDYLRGDPGTPPAAQGLAAEPETKPRASAFID